MQLFTLRVSCASGGTKKLIERTAATNEYQFSELRYRGARGVGLRRSPDAHPYVGEEETDRSGPEVDNVFNGITYLLTLSQRPG